jgi:hypothetical protein
VTARQPVYRITTGPCPPRAARHRYGILRGLAAVAALLLTAADQLVSAFTGLPPVACLWGRLAAAVRAAYRRGAIPPPEMAAALITHDPEREHT